MKLIDTYIIEKLHLKQGIDRGETNFSKDMKKLFKLLKGQMGQEEHYEIMCDMMKFTSEDEYDDYGKYVFDEKIFQRLLYSIVNYDLISLYNRNIDINNSNHPDIARILKKYATKEMINKVYDSLFVR